MNRSKVVGISLLLISFLIGIIYPFLLIYLKEQDAIKLLIYTATVISISLGAFIGAVGIILLRGFRTSGNAKDTG